MVVLEQPNSSERHRDNTLFGGPLKRVQDALIAVLVLIIMAPLMLVIAAAVKLQDDGPALFRQVRVGRYGAPFAMLKFRSMVPDATGRLKRLLEEDPEAAREWGEKQKLANDPRVTPLGRLLRSTSLDELPQFLNVLLGHMSVVGPRPILPEQVNAYGAGFSLYCTARPGITGLWQVAGRSDTTFQRRSEFDQTYLRTWSAITDITLILRTFSVVIGRRGAC
ncbi:sugar transferase [Phenylobacterium sp.]|jgi:lipopolysaccharide/colanic/teichoic acid biosynthesis glycosyltransferase|uniref:sugar transferase n=1 Tax=Phenylobacterium sp. TaxID=1871053 RepID=UPI002E36299B|nr:sugar transferase [Phenylobacterium sp.]HEX4709849.1 sugar transferase [Phenylobacterium sp.]